MMGCGEWELAGVRCYGVDAFRPMSGFPVRAVPLAALIPSPGPGRGPGGMGRSASVKGGQAGSITGAPAPEDRGGAE